MARTFVPGDVLESVNPFPVELGKIIEFCRVLDLGDPIVSTLRPGKPLAPLIFTEALRWWRGEGSIYTRLGLDLNRVLDAERQYIYLRPICAGDVLSAQTMLCGIEERLHRASAQFTAYTLESIFRDQNGDEVLRSKQLVMESAESLEKRLALPAAPAPETRRQRYDRLRRLFDRSSPTNGQEIDNGDPLQMTIPAVTLEQIVRYSGAAGAFNPIHFDPDYARSKGLPNVFAMGMLQAGFMSRLVQSWIGIEMVRRFVVRFLSPVWLGDSLYAKGQVISSEEQRNETAAEFLMLNQDGKAALYANVIAAPLA